MVFGGKIYPPPIFLSPDFRRFSHFLSPDFAVVDTLVLDTRCLCCVVDILVLDTRCLCCLRILEPRRLQLPSLALFGREILSFLAGNLFKGILTENFLCLILAGGRSRTAEPWITGPSSYPLDHEGLVERIISELPDEL